MTKVYGIAPRRIDTADVAKLVRKALAQAFPATVFRVRISRYSMGSSIDVRWTDGPTTHRVEELAGGFKGSTFDGSDDSTRYHDSTLNGEAVHYSNNFIHFRRDYSDRFVARVAEGLRERLGLQVPGTLNAAAGLYIASHNDWASTLIHRLAEDRTFYDPAAHDDDRWLGGDHYLADPGPGGIRVAMGIHRDDPETTA
jgi:hypothetical protein